jgi:hypothetical protein
MRQVAKKGLMTVAATSGVLAVTSGLAYANAGAQGAAADSPGVLSGNQAQVPVHVPVNACGNTVDVVGALNPAFGNRCVNASGNGRGGAFAGGGATGSPGVASGNDVQVPVHVPVNACGNTVDVVGALNPAFGNRCTNAESSVALSTTTPPFIPSQPTPGRGIPSQFTPSRGIPRHQWTPGLPPFQQGYHHGWDAGSPELAHTGADMLALTAIPASAGLLIGGSLLYRRGRCAAARG